MATPKLLTTLIRRSRPLYHTLSFSSQYRNFLLPSSPPPKSSEPIFPQHLIKPYNCHFHRFFSSVNSYLPSDDDHPTLDNQSDLIPTVDLVSVGSVSVGYDDSLLPIRAFISILDGYHDLSGFPWWLVLTSSTVVLRLTIFPILILQLHKLKKIGELLPKLPPPFPPPLSEGSVRSHIKLFLKEKKAVGCPSFLWFLAIYAVQIPALLMWISTIHTMSQNHHLGFDAGGILWFTNLAESPHGLWGPIFPLSVAALHYINVQVSFKRMSIGKVSQLFGNLVKYYQKYLELLTIPILFGSFYFTQGPLLCWFTNSSLTLIQQLALNNPDIREKLGLPDKTAHVAVDQVKIAKPRKTDTDQSGSVRKVSVDTLSPKELVALSVKYLSSERPDEAIPFLRLALDKDPEYVRALLIMGQILLRKGLGEEAVDFLESAISKLRNSGPPVEVEDVDLLILSSTWAGAAYIRQGKFDEGLLHLERLTSMKEPSDEMSKNHYYDGLLMLSRALLSAGRKAEAIEHLKRATAYDPERYGVFLPHCENDEDDFVDDLANSRRRDQ